MHSENGVVALISVSERSTQVNAVNLLLALLLHLPEVSGTQSLRTVRAACATALFPAIQSISARRLLCQLPYRVLSARSAYASS